MYNKGIIKKGMKLSMKVMQRESEFLSSEITGAENAQIAYELFDHEDVNAIESAHKVSNKEHKIGVKTTVPLVAKLLNTDEQTINEICDLESIINKRKE